MKEIQDDNLVPDPTSTTDNNGNKPASKNASGPKTPAGRRRVRLNARTHGFYSRELVVTLEDTAEFEALKKGIRTNLKPTTQLQLLGFERVVSAAWRCKLALRMEARRLRPQLDSTDRLNSGEVSTELPPWYTARRQQLNRAIKFLTELRSDVLANGDQNLEEQKDLIVNVLGSDFYKTLAQWGPINTVKVLASEQLQGHAEIFKRPLPSGSVVSEEVVFAAERVRWDMMAKLVELKLQAAGEFHRLSDEALGEAESPQTVALDVVNRYVTSTARELERAVDWYRQLLDMGL
jgi:hypothetical protein